MAYAGQPEYHPVWQDILAALGEDVRSIEVPGGRLMYTVATASIAGGRVTVVNSMPFIAYGGPQAVSHEVARTLLETLSETAVHLDADVVSIGTSPLMTVEEEEIVRNVLQPTHVFENTVQLQSLTTHPLEQLSKKRRAAIESELRRGERAGYVVVDRLDSAQLEEWIQIYRERYAEIGALPYPDEFHRQLHTRGVEAGVAEFRGLLDPDTSRLVGGIVLLLSPLVATYFSSAFVSAARGSYPTTFVLNAAFRDFRNRGIHTFNWHSSPASGGVHAYKRRWGARPHRHFYVSKLRKPNSALFRLSTREVSLHFPFRFVLPFSAWPPATMW